MDAKFNDTPMATTTKLDRDDARIGVDETKYREIIRSLLYLTASRSDMFSVGMCVRFQSKHKESHLKVTKRILRYLKGFMNLVLWYPASTSFKLVGFANIDYAGYLVDRKNTSGMTHFL